MRILIIFCAFLFAQSHATAQLSIIEIQADGKKMHIALDRAKNYRLGDVINFYENRKLVTQGKISFLTPQKTKAVVSHFKGKPFQGNYMARAQYLNQSNSAVARSSAAPRQTQARNQVRRQAPRQVQEEEVQRQPASVSSPRPTPPNFNKVGTTKDLLFYPAANSWLLSLSGSYGQQDIEINTFPNITATGSGLGATLGYSPIDRLVVALGLGYKHMSTKSGTLSDTASGITNPQLTVSYQIMSQQEDNFHWVPILGVSPSIGESTDSNVLSGNTVLSLQSYFAMRHSAFSWSLTPSLIYFTQTKTENSANDMESNFNIGLLSELQYDFNERWAVYSPLAIRYNTEEKASDGSFKVLGYTSYSAGIGFKHALSQDTNLFFVGKYAVIPNIEFEDSTGASASGKQSEFEINLGMNFSF